MRKWNLVHLHPIPAHEQPFGASLLRRVAAVAGSPLRDLHDQHLQITVKNSQERTAAPNLIAKGFCRYSQTFSRNLAEAAVRCSV